MSVSAHLAIALDEYDARIRTFIPSYEEMLDVAADVASGGRPRLVVDLGTGSGALAARVAQRVRGVSLVGIDADEGMLGMARRRLPRGRTRLVCDSFLAAPLPRSDAMIASLALHHVASHRVKRRLFARAHAALRPGGVLVSADCHPSALPPLARAGHRAWIAHLATSYGPAKARAFLRAWADEDFYTTLETELALLQSSGFVTDVVWRRGSFAVIAAERA